MSRETHYTLQIVGVAWHGFKALYEYTLPDREAALLVAQEGCNAAKKYAGDFQAVTDCRVVESSHEYEWPGTGLYRRTDTYKTLRGFRSGMTPARFHRRINGFA